MAADLPVPSGSSNPCCAELKKKFEEVKTSLKEAISIIERKSNALQEEKLKTKLEKEAKKKEIVVRKILESDIKELKAQIASLSQEAKNPLTADKSGDELERVKHELERVKQLLEEEKKRALSEKMNATNNQNLLLIEKSKVEEQRRLVQIERTRANELNASIEKVKCEFEESRNQLAKRVEEEKQKANREKRRADTEKGKLGELKKYAEMEKKRAFEEKSRADSLLKKLEEEREKTKDLLKRLEDERKRNKGFRAKLAVESSQKGKGGISVEKEDLNVKLVKEKLKLKKAQLKHVNKILKLEKSKNNIIKQELSLLKQDFVQISGRFKVLDSHLNIGGTSDLAKVILSLPETAAPLTATTERDVFLREGGAPHMSRQSQSRPVSGTSSESLPPNRQTFAFFSDKKLLMGPQDRERDASVSSPSLLQNQKNTEACKKYSLKASNVSHKRKRKESLDPKKKVKNKIVKNLLNSEVVEFEKMVREGGVLKLLEFENEDLEKKFKSAMEGFLSPNLPQIAPHENAKASCKSCTAHLVGKDEDEHSIPEFDLKSSSDMTEMVGADVERHERSECKNANGESLEGGNEKHSHYFLLVFSNLNENSIARIGRIWKEITIEESSILQTIDLSARVLQLASKSELTPEDKFSVISSLFASEICCLLKPHSTGVANFYFDKYIRSCTEKICSVLLLSEEMLQLFIEDRHLEIVTSLLQDFLIYKQVLVYKNGDLCSTVSSRFQYISGCIIFALICAKTNQLDLIRGTAYRVLLDCKSDISHALISTHVFANICGERLFGTNKERLLQNALCWVVRCIEKGGAKDLGFAPCQQCPFKMEAVGTEEFVDSLLDELEACSLLKHQEPHFGCGEHCSTCMAERNGLCYFTEIVSLLELVGSYMAWECAYNKLVCRLFKILESCGHEELSTSILVLIGHLPRCVVDEGRCDQIQVLELRDKLLNFMGTRNKSGLALQFACIGALLNLLPIKFKQIVLGKDNLSSHKGRLGREICQIRSWFSGLSVEQKGAFQSLLMT